MSKLSIISILGFVFFLSSISVVECDESHDHDIVFSKLPTKLKSSVSDMTATYVEDLKGDGVEAIIIAGGCSGGNKEFVEEVDGKNITNYYCDAVTDAVHVFYPSTETIVTVAPMPSQRYRHGAAFVNGKLYLVGGRTLYDDLIKDVIVYDPKDGDLGSWKTHLTLGDDHTFSDIASFGKDGNIYVLGGYDATYTASAKVFTINVETNAIVNLESMGTSRGDAQAVYYNEGNVEGIFAVGGFTHANEFCDPLSHGEKYDFKTNKWTEIDHLENKRGDKGLVVINKKILAIGGEAKHESYCDDESSISASSYSIAVDDVESFNPQDGSDAEWHVESDFPSFRFRSAAASSEKLGKVYVFGGQLTYDNEFKGYPVSSDIYYFRDSGAAGRKIGFALSVIVGSFVALLW